MCFFFFEDSIILEEVEYGILEIMFEQVCLLRQWVQLTSRPGKNQVGLAALGPELNY